MASEALRDTRLFPPVSGEVAGADFIGRSAEVSAVRCRLLCGDGTVQSVAIVGMPRIGKTSLARAVTDTAALRAIYPRVVAARVSVDTCNSLDMFWEAVAAEVSDAIEADFPDVWESVAERCRQRPASGGARSWHRFLRRLLPEVSRQGLRVVLWLDELDAFRDFVSIQSVGMLRELASGSSYGLALLTCSRATIEDIETANDDGPSRPSTLHGIFAERLYLKPFSTADMDEYWRLAEQRGGMPIAETYRTLAATYAGRHPKLLNWVNARLFPLYVKGVERLPEADLLELNGLFDTDVTCNLKRLSIYSALLQLTIGPRYDVTQAQEETLLRYGMLSDIGPGVWRQWLPGIANSNAGRRPTYYASLSPHFMRWLFRDRLALPYQPLWERTENNLRRLVAAYLDSHYGPDDDAREAFYTRNGLEKYVEPMRVARETYVSNVNPRGWKTLEWFSTTGSLFPNYISRDWLWYQRVLGETEEVWRHRFDRLRQIRNSVGHSQAVDDTTLLTPKMTCEKINALIDKHLGPVATPKA